MTGIWDWFQQAQINSNAARTDQARGDARYAVDRVSELERRIETLSLLCRALVEELEQATGVSQDQIKARMLAIDLRDGVEDGKYDPLIKCPGCGRQIRKQRGGCMWCGHKLSTNGVP